MTPTHHLKCECEKPTNNKLSLSHCGRCRLPILPIPTIAEEQDGDFETIKVSEYNKKFPTTKPNPYKSWEETWLEDVPMPSPVDGEWEKELTVIAKNVFLLHSVPPQMREAFAVFIFRVTKLITSLLHAEREKERERIVKMCDEMRLDTSPAEGYNNPDADVYNKALSDLRNKITNNV